MSFYFQAEQLGNLNLTNLFAQRTTTEIIELCFEYLTCSGPDVQPQQRQCYELQAQKCGTDVAQWRLTMEALIALMLDTQAGETEIKMLLQRKGGMSEAVSAKLVEVLTQFVNSKRRFVDFIKLANIRAHRLVNLEWRLEIRVASRSLLRQSNICVTMKLYLHTEPKNENRDLLSGDEEHETELDIHPDERRNRKDMLVQTDLNSLLHIIQSLEDALVESRTRRIRNIVDAIH